VPRFLKTEGIVLRKYDFSETSQVLTVLTRNLGRLQLLAKGSRRIRKKPVAFLDLLDRAEMVLIPKPPGNLSTLTEARIVDDHAGIRTDLLRIALAFHAGELVYLASPEHQPIEPLFDLTTAALEELGRAPRGALPAVTLAFEIRFLRRIGFGLEFERCVGCGREGRPLAEPYFGPVRGGILCPACRGSDPAAIRVPTAVAGMLRGLGAGSWESAIRSRVPLGMFRHALRVLRAESQVLFERNLRAACFLERIAFPPDGPPPP